MRTGMAVPKPDPMHVSRERAAERAIRRVVPRLVSPENEVQTISPARALQARLNERIIQAFDPKPTTQLTLSKLCTIVGFICGVWMVCSFIGHIS